MKLIFLILLLSFVTPWITLAQEKREGAYSRWGLLLIPSEETIQEGEWIKSLEQFKKIKATVVLNDVQLKKISEFRLRTVELMNEGRLELALHLSSSSVSETSLEEAKSTFKNFCGEFPKGFVPENGVLEEETTDLLEEKEFSWILNPTPLELEKSKDLEIPQVFVWDESSSPWSLNEVLSETEKRLSSSKAVEILLVQEFGVKEILGQSWDWLKKGDSTVFTNQEPEKFLKVQMKSERSQESVEFTQTENFPAPDLLLQGLHVKSSLNNIEPAMVSYQFLFKEGAQEKIDQMRLYIDLNHRIGAGRISLLEKSNVGVPAEDAWEYEILCEKLSPTVWNCQLLSANQPRPLFVTLGQIPEDKSSLEIQIPKKLLGRDPLRWGFLVCIINSESRIQDFLSSLEKKGEMLQKIKEASNLDGETLLLPMMRSQ